MSPFFITSTGTGIGKTFVTCGLIEAFRQQGRDVCAIKPVISGWEYCEPGDNAANDTVNILKSLGIPVSIETIRAVSPWRFTAPLSPDMAAALEGRGLSFTEIVAFCQASFTHEMLLIEGAGGVMTPLEGINTMRDLMQAVSAQAIMVTGSYLGSLSHTLTALEALHIRQIPCPLLIVSESENSTVLLADTVESLRRFTTSKVIALPRILSKEERCKTFLNISEMLSIMPTN